MPSSKLAFILVLLLASVVSRAQITQSGNNWTTTCAVAAVNCVVAASNVNIDDVLVVYMFTPLENNLMTAVSGGGTYTMCTACTITNPGPFVGAASGQGATIMMAYATATVAGAFNIIVTRQTTGYAWKVGYVGLRAATGFRVDFDTAGTALRPTNQYPYGPTLITAGPGGFIMSVVLGGSGNPGLNPSSNACWAILRALGGNAISRCFNTISGASPAMIWNLGAQVISMVSAIAFREAPITIAPPLPSEGLSLGAASATSFTSGVGISGGPPGGAPALASVTVTPATATVSGGGQALAFTATGTWTDSSTGDVTPICTWSDNTANLLNPTFVMSDAYWTTQLAESGSPYSLRGNPQTIRFSQNGTALIHCQITHLGGPIIGTSVVQIGPVSVSPSVATPFTVHLGQSFSVTFTAAGGTAPYTYQDLSNYAGNAQWFGLLLTGNTLAGSPGAPPNFNPATYTFSMRVTDSATPTPNVGMFQFTVDEVYP